METELQSQHGARIWLHEEFARRRAQNNHYSLRAFATFLRIPSGRLSEILSNKRKLTPRLGHQIADRLAYTPEMRAKLLDCIRAERSLKDKAAQPGNTNTVTSEIDNYQQISIDSFYIISDWYHFAILSLIDTRDFQNDPKWISKRLGISLVDARTALDRLQRVHVIKLENGHYVKTSKNMTTGLDIASVAIRRYHWQMLYKTIAALDDVSVENRDITSTTMAIDPAKIPAVKKMIQQFHRQLCAFLEADKGTEVYALNVQLVPITAPKPKEGSAP